MKTTTIFLSTFLVAFTLILASVSTSNAQNSNSSSRPVDDSNTEINSPSTEAPSTGKPPAEKPAGHEYLGSYEFTITIMVGAIGLIALAMEFILLRRVDNLRAEDALRVFAVTLIIVGTLFFISAGFDSIQIAPAMGLFGTVSGYLLGRSIDRKEFEKQ
ncbi:MAG: hypothetical protein ACREBG_19720 [Pyrinomonadaceae bacterium]